MNTKKVNNWIGIIVILLAGAVHLYMAIGEFNETPYMGILFFGFFIASIVSAIGIYRGELIWGWALGVFLCIGAIVGYLISRTVGMPVAGVEDWGPPLAYFSILIELFFFYPLLKSNPNVFKVAR